MLVGYEFLQAEKSIQFLQHTRVPIVAIVENMSYFEAHGKAYPIFGKPGNGLRGIENICLHYCNKDEHPQPPWVFDHGDGDKKCSGTFKLPITPLLAETSDHTTHANGVQSSTSKFFDAVATHLVLKVAEKNLSERSRKPNSLEYNETSGMLELTMSRHAISDHRLGTVLLIHPTELRRLSRDALNDRNNIILTDDEANGDGGADNSLAGSASHLKNRKAVDQVLPTKINRKGNYGFEVQWSTGERGSIYT